MGEDRKSRAEGQNGAFGPIRTFDRLAFAAKALTLASRTSGAKSAMKRREVVRTKPDVIFAIANVLALSFKRATTSIPIVILGGDVVINGITESIARPGKNITGINAQEQLIYGKRMSLLRDAVPRLSNLGL